MKETIIAAAKKLLKSKPHVTVYDVVFYLSEVLPDLNLVGVVDVLASEFDKRKEGVSTVYFIKPFEIAKGNLTSVLDKYWGDTVNLRFKKINKQIRDYRVELVSRDEFGYLHFNHDGTQKKCLLRNVLKINNLIVK